MNFIRRIAAFFHKPEKEVQMVDPTTYEGHNWVDAKVMGHYSWECSKCGIDYDQQPAKCTS